MKTSARTLRTAESNVRTPALPATNNSLKRATAHSSVASRLLNALMKALAAPHI